MKAPPSTGNSPIAPFHFTFFLNSHFLMFFWCSILPFIKPSTIIHQLIPAGIYLLSVNDRNTKSRCKIHWKLTIKTPEWRQWRRSGAFIVNFEHISHFVIVFLLLTLNMKLPTGIYLTDCLFHQLIYRSFNSVSRSNGECLGRPYNFKFFKGCLPQILIPWPIYHWWFACKSSVISRNLI